MAKIKLNSEINSLFGKSGGSCFQSSAKGVQMKNNAHMRRFRTQPQKKISEYFISGTRHWRNLGSTGQANWLAFAEFLPQPQIRFPEQSISAYENFVKRNAYLQISNSDANLWMSVPALIEYEKDELSVLCNVGPVSISLDCAFVNADSNLDCLLFLSGIQSPGENYIHTVYRYMYTIANSSQQIDITEPFLSNFGNLPPVGSKLFFSVIFCGSDNGQFWFPENVPVITEPMEPPFVTSRNGFFYNCFNLASIVPVGWRLPTYSELLSMYPITVDAELLCLQGSDWWLNSDWGILDSDLCLIGDSYRSADTGEFLGVKQFSMFWFSYLHLFFTYFVSMENHAVSFANGQKLGVSLRFLKDADGFTDRCIGNNGLVYPVVQIGSFLITAINSQETLFNDGSPIPELSSDSAWISATSQSFCKRSI